MPARNDPSGPDQYDRMQMSPELETGPNVYHDPPSAQSFALTVVIIDPFGKHSGHHYYVGALATALCAHGARVLVHVTEQTGVTGVEPYEATVSFGQLYGPEPAWKRGIRYVRGMIRAMISARKRGAQVVNLHIFNFDLRDAFAAWLARLLGMKAVLTLHDVENFGKQSHRLMRRLTLAGGNGYILHNAYSYSSFQNTKCDQHKPVAVLPHGHYCNSFASVPSRKQARCDLGLPLDTPIFLFFGNSRHEKGLDLLIEACGNLSAQEDWLLLIAGKMKPHLYAYYSALAQCNDPGGHMRIDAKHISDEETAAYYRAADLVVVPYRSIYESGVTIMAMSLGRALLVSDLPPLVDSIAGGQAGLIFASEDRVALTAALENALDRRAELDHIGECGYRHVRDVRDWGKIGASTLDFLQKIRRPSK